MFLFCLVFAMPLCTSVYLCLVFTYWERLTSWLLWCLTVSLPLSHWYPGSSVVLDCIDSWSLHPYLLCHILFFQTLVNAFNVNFYIKMGWTFNFIQKLAYKGSYCSKAYTRYLVWYIFTSVYFNWLKMQTPLILHFWCRKLNTICPINAWHQTVQHILNFHTILI